MVPTECISLFLLALIILPACFYFIFCWDLTSVSKLCLWLFYLSLLLMSNLHENTKLIMKLINSTIIDIFCSSFSLGLNIPITLVCNIEYRNLLGIWPLVYFNSLPKFLSYKKLCLRLLTLSLLLLSNLHENTKLIMKLITSTITDTCCTSFSLRVKYSYYTHM